ncbi:MAG TPA: hypothetical protein IAA32_06575 [Candidatus Butyricicoccus stercorigallinarum]|nr:hypothetical protein [Candidatus Butyricicoccus stercorigallinarum]
MSIFVIANTFYKGRTAQRRHRPHRARRPDLMKQLCGIGSTDDSTPKQEKLQAAARRPVIDTTGAMPYNQKRENRRPRAASGGIAHV